MQGKDIENIIKNISQDENGMKFNFLYNLQKKFQEEVCNKIGYYDEKISELPTNNVRAYQYHCMCLLEELGELVKSDKRWKNFRNDKYDKDNKLEEIADCFIVLYNICLFSGFSDKEIEQAIFDKILGNFDRIYKNAKGEK